MPPQKGKQGTRGAKQIVEENVATLIFYRNMGIGATAIYMTLNFLLFQSIFDKESIFAVFLTSVVYAGCYILMDYAAKPTYSETGQLADAGIDLNMEGGLAEHVKDLIILTVGSQILSLVSSYFWLLMILAPVYAAFKLWKHVLGPWFFQQGNENPDAEDKKQKKLERKRVKKMN